MDKLEKYIKDHREQFDDRYPPAHIWDQISSRLPQQREGVRRIVMWKWMTVAAVTLALVMCGVVAGMYMGRNAGHSDPAYAEFMQAQQYYNLEFDKRKNELARHVYDPEVDNDLRELDAIYQDLSHEFKSTNAPDKSELINAMIQVYRARIELLERVLNKIEQNNNENQIDHEDENVRI